MRYLLTTALVGAVSSRLAYAAMGELPGIDFTRSQGVFGPFPLPEGASPQSTGIKRTLSDNDSLELSRSAVTWSGHTRSVSFFLDVGKSIEDDNIFKQQAMRALTSALDEPVQKTVMEKYILDDPVVSVSNQTLENGSFQGIVDNLRVMVSRGKDMSNLIDAINAIRCPQILPSIDSYFAVASRVTGRPAESAVRPAACGKVLAAISAGRPAPGGIPGSPILNPIAIAASTAQGSGSVGANFNLPGVNIPGTTNVNAAQTANVVSAKAPAPPSQFPVGNIPNLKAASPQDLKQIRFQPVSAQASAQQAVPPIVPQFNIDATPAPATRDKAAGFGGGLLGGLFGDLLQAPGEGIGAAVGTLGGLLGGAGNIANSVTGTLSTVTGGGGLGSGGIIKRDTTDLSKRQDASGNFGLFTNIARLPGGLAGAVVDGAEGIIDNGVTAGNGLISPIVNLVGLGGTGPGGFLGGLLGGGGGQGGFVKRDNEKLSKRQDASGNFGLFTNIARLPGGLAGAVVDGAEGIIDNGVTAGNGLISPIVNLVGLGGTGPGGFLGGLLGGGGGGGGGGFKKEKRDVVRGVGRFARRDAAPKMDENKDEPVAQNKRFFGLFGKEGGGIGGLLGGLYGGGAKSQDTSFSTLQFGGGAPAPLSIPAPAPLPVPKPAAPATFPIGAPAAIQSVGLLDDDNDGVNLNLNGGGGQGTINLGGGGNGKPGTNLNGGGSGGFNVNLITSGGAPFGAFGANQGIEPGTIGSVSFGRENGQTIVLGPPNNGPVFFTGGAPQGYFANCPCAAQFF